MTTVLITCASCNNTLRANARFCPICGAAVRRPRLNPFVFPMETDSRFWLLVIAVAGASILVFSMLYNALPANWEAFQAAEARCKAQQAVAQARGDVTISTVFAQCKMPNDRARALWALGGLTILFAVASVSFFAIPRLLVWRHELRPLGDKPAGIKAELAALCEAADIRPAPTFVVSRFFRGARVFGWRGRYYVAMGQALADTYASNPALFRAVMRHELAHLRNADVEKTYFTIALCAAFGIVGVLPLAAMLLHNPLALTLGMAWRVVGLAALVALVGASVLRARETYADLRASIWDGTDGALREVLDRHVARQASKSWHPLRLHPAPQARRAVVDDTESLFELSPWEAFGAGIASTITFMAIVLLLVDPLIVAPLLQWQWATLLLGLVTSLLFGPAIFGVVGVGVWRATFGRIAGQRVRRRIGRLAVGLGAGMLIGLKLSLAEALFEQVEQPAQWLALAAFDAAWCAALIACLAVVLAWAAESAEAWLPVTANGPTPRAVHRAGLALGGSALAVVLGVFAPAYLLRLMIVLFEHFVKIAPQYNLNLPGSPGVALALIVGAALVVLVLNPLTTLVLIVFWVYPLAASRGPRASTFPTWGLLDATPVQPSISGDMPKMKLVLTLGGRGGMVFSLAAAVLALLGALGGDRATVSLPLIVGLIVVLGVLVQVGVALIVAMRMHTLRLAHGLGAASITGTVATILAVALLWPLGVLTPPTALLIAAVIFNGGGVASLVVVCSVVVLAKLLGRAKARSAELQQLPARS